ncbi:LLM class oxidoreductase [Pseudomonas xanthosomatis]|uniref:LLM class oxidoreductase n=1 Tax=Pseudomonas xanthosomatis TaxID=2842356 RepID=UPI003516520D
MTVELSRHTGFAHAFQPGRLSLGFIMAIESYKGAVPTLANHAELACRAEELGFAALWARDVPLLDPNFGDAGQVFDPFVYLGYLAAKTERIALGTSSAVLPLRHPIHLAKAASSVDQLSGGRLLLGVASGDRPTEYPAFNIDFESRGLRFQQTLHALRELSEQSFPKINAEGLINMDGQTDLIPKAVHGRIPAFVTGTSRQQLSWIAQHADGWLYYILDHDTLRRAAKDWQQLVNETSPGQFKPLLQGMNFDLAENPNELPKKIHSGYRMGRNALIQFLREDEKIGVSHMALNLKYGSRPAAEVMEELAEFVLPHFPSH